MKKPMTGPQAAPDSPGGVLQLIRSGQAASRSDVARLVGVSASTAAGLMSRHLKELDAFLTEAFA